VKCEAYFTGAVSSTFATSGSIKVLFIDLSLNVIRVSEIDAMGKTNIVGTSGDKSVVHPVITKVTLYCHVSFHIKGHGVVWTSLNTELASCAFLFFHEHNTVIPSCNGLFRTDLHTCGRIAVHADIHLKYENRSAINEFGTVFQNIDQFDAVRGAVFLLAGHFAGFASPAGFVIYDECIFFHQMLPSRFLRVNPNVAKVEGAADPRRQGCSCSNLPQAFDNAGDAVPSAFP
jgi:hypothetical protein